MVHKIVKFETLHCGGCSNGKLFKIYGIDDKEILIVCKECSEVYKIYEIKRGSIERC